MLSIEGYTMKIFILPGGTSPYGQNKKHCDSYRDIWTVLKQMRSSVDVSILTYPGQKSVQGIREGELRFPSSVQALRDSISQSEEDDIRLVCICWGCQTGAAVCATDCALVRKVLFWAPVPFWKLYEVCVLKDDLWAGQEEHRGVKVTPEVLNGITPFELSIQNIAGTDCCVAVGTRDEYVTPDALPYFKSLVPRKQNFAFRIVEGCPHTVVSADASWKTFQSEVLHWIVE